MRNFEAIKSTRPRMPEEAAEIAAKRKGKRNKPQRGNRVEWSYGEHQKTNVGAPAGRYHGEYGHWEDKL